MKRIVRPSWRAFFDGGPAHAPPAADLLLVSLAGSSDRPLATPAHEGQPTLLGIGRAYRTVAQVLPHGTGRYANPEFQFQLIGDALLAPDRVVRSHLSD